MVKKIIVGGLLLVTIGALAIGATQLLNQSPSAHSRERHSHEGHEVQPRRAFSNEMASGGGHGREQGGRESTGGPEIVDDSTPDRGYGRGRGRGGGQGNPQRIRTEPQADAAAWQTVEGVVVETDGPVIEIAGRETVQVGLGPSDYRHSQGF